MSLLLLQLKIPTSLVLVSLLLGMLGKLSWVGLFLSLLMVVVVVVLVVVVWWW